MTKQLDGREVDVFFKKISHIEVLPQDAQLKEGVTIDEALKKVELLGKAAKTPIETKIGIEDIPPLVEKTVFEYLQACNTAFRESVSIDKRSYLEKLEQVQASISTYFLCQKIGVEPASELFKKIKRNGLTEAGVGEIFAASYEAIAKTVDSLSIEIENTERIECLTQSLSELREVLLELSDEDLGDVVSVAMTAQYAAQYRSDYIASRFTEMRAEFDADGGIIPPDGSEFRSWLISQDMDSIESLDHQVAMLYDLFCDVPGIVEIEKPEDLSVESVLTSSWINIRRAYLSGNSDPTPALNFVLDLNGQMGFAFDEIYNHSHIDYTLI